jgi:hypothetical protein
MKGPIHETKCGAVGDGKPTSHKTNVPLERLGFEGHRVKVETWRKFIISTIQAEDDNRAPNDGQSFVLHSAFRVQEDPPGRKLVKSLPLARKFRSK